MHVDRISDALVTNKIGSSVTLEDGVLLGTFEVLDLPSIEEPLPLPVAGVNVQNADVTDLTDVMARLRPTSTSWTTLKPSLLFCIS